VVPEVQPVLRRHALRRRVRHRRLRQQRLRLPVRLPLQLLGQTVAPRRKWPLPEQQSSPIARYLAAPLQAVLQPAAPTSAEEWMTHSSARKIRQPELRVRAILKSATI
jgi:hypothetical protein